MTKYEILKLASVGAMETWFREHTKNENMKENGICSEIQDIREKKAWEQVQEVHRMLIIEETKKIKAEEKQQTQPAI